MGQIKPTKTLDFIFGIFNKGNVFLQGCSLFCNVGGSCNMNTPNAKTIRNPIQVREHLSHERKRGQEGKAFETD